MLRRKESVSWQRENKEKITMQQGITTDKNGSFQFQKMIFYSSNTAKQPNRMELQNRDIRVTQQEDDHDLTGQIICNAYPSDSVWEDLQNLSLSLHVWEREGWIWMKFPHLFSLFLLNQTRKIFFPFLVPSLYLEAIYRVVLCFFPPSIFPGFFCLTNFFF